MDPSAFHLRIAERFAKLSTEQRRAVFEKVQAAGMNALDQFPVLAREPSMADRCPASHAQARQWFLWRMALDGSAYHIAGALRFHGALDKLAMQASLTDVVQRHEALRTVFDADEAGHVHQRVLPEAAFTWIDLDLRGQAGAWLGLDGDAAGELPPQVQDAANRMASQPFDLQRGPLLRVGLVRYAADAHLLVVVMHHIVADDASMDIMVDEFVKLYRARGQGVPADLPPVPVQCADHSVWQRHWLESGEAVRQLAWWRGALGDHHPVLQLPADHARSAAVAQRAARHEVEVPEGLSRAVLRKSLAQGSTVFMTLLGALHGLLHRWTGQGDVRVGVAVANRQRPELQGVIGLFVNTLVLRNEVSGEVPLSQVMAQAREAALGAQAHQDLPFDQLVQALQPERSLSHTPLFQVMFNHLRQDSGVLDQMPGLRVQAQSLGGKTAQFELVLDSLERADGSVRLSWIYAGELFEAQTIERLAGHHLALLQAWVDDDTQALGDVRLLQASEQAQLSQWGGSGQEGCADVGLPCVHESIAAQARSQPDAIALVFGDQALSFAELDARANQLAHHLIAQGMGRETRVGVALPRSLEMIVTLLAILKAGGAWVPLDVDYPAQRLAYMAQDSGVALVVSQRSLLGQPVLDALSQHRLLALDELELSAQPSTPVAVPVHPEQAAYVIYTSGSTGRPKGAVNRHGSLASCMAWMQTTYGLQAGQDAVLHKAPFGFDVSVWEIFWPLTVGVKLVLAQPGDQRDPQRIVALIRQHAITTVNFVPSMLQAFLGHEGIEAHTRLRHIICGGEAMPAAVQEEALRRLQGASLQNLYGPTEATIHVTRWTCQADGRSLVPIGRPIEGVRAQVLDERLNPVAIGVAGELYLGGIHLGRGYLNRAGLTAERFVADAHGGTGERLYRTGDLVRWNAQGQLEYLGRLDHQVKIRGLRIELGEVEAALQAQAGIHEAVVVAQREAGVGTGAAAQEGAARLVAYVSPSQAQAGQGVETAGLRRELLKSLPDYMVPQVIVELASLPLNANGKVDRQALPAVQAVQAHAQGQAGQAGQRPATQAPQGEVEQALAQIWARVLGLAPERIGRHDNFFEIGGHSLLVLQVIDHARRSASLPRLTVRDVFAAPTLAQLAEHQAVGNQTIALNAADPALPILFTLHDGWGSVLDHTVLARSLSGQCRVIGLPCTAADLGRLTAHGEPLLMDLANAHANTVEQLQPAGALRLCGWSLGGALAPWVAGVLEARGRQVALVASIDPYVQGAGPRPSEKVADQLKAFFAILVPDRLHAELLSDDRITSCLEQLIDPEVAIGHLLGLVMERVDRSALHDYAALTDEELASLFMTARALTLCSLRHDGPASSLCAPLHVWWSAERQKVEVDRFAQWMRLRDVRNQWVDADHLRIVKDPVLIKSMQQAMRTSLV